MSSRPSKTPRRPCGPNWRASMPELTLLVEESLNAGAAGGRGWPGRRPALPRGPLKPHRPPAPRATCRCRSKGAASRSPSSRTARSWARGTPCSISIGRSGPCSPRAARPGRDPVCNRHPRGCTTPIPKQLRRVLESFGVASLGPAAADGNPRRAGDWLIVARKDPSGPIFGIARPMGESLREIRRASVRNLSLGLLVIALALIGIVPISHGMTRHLTSLDAGDASAGGRQLPDAGARALERRVRRAKAFNQMAEDLERHQALVVERERLRKELELSRLIQTEMLPRASLRLGAAEIKGISIPPAKSAETSSTTSRCRTAGSRCSSATSQGREERGTADGQRAGDAGGCRTSPIWRGLRPTSTGDRRNDAWRGLSDVVPRHPRHGAAGAPACERSGTILSS